MEKEQEQKALKELEPLLGEIFALEGIHDMNWKVDGIAGHPFTIGPKHVAYASDNCHGMLGMDVVEKIGCAHTQCGKPWKSHTHDTVLFLKLKGHTHEEKVRTALSNAQVINIMTQSKIDGFILVETKEKFRVHKETLPV